ncbi:MAG: hypothetical protein PHW47_01375 [Lachnospira sp.]|nr:hypothetical protein [Lachnospira sp.]
MAVEIKEAKKFKEERVAQFTKINPAKTRAPESKFWDEELETKP